MATFDDDYHKNQLIRKCRALIQNSTKNSTSASEYKEQLFDLLIQDQKNMVEALYKEIFNSKIINDIPVTFNEIEENLVTKTKGFFPFYYSRLNDGSIGGIVPGYSLSEGDQDHLQSLLRSQCLDEIGKIKAEYKNYQQQKENNNNSKWAKILAFWAIVVTIITTLITPFYNKRIEALIANKQQSRNNVPSDIKNISKTNVIVSVPKIITKSKAQNIHISNNPKNAQSG